MVSEFIQSLRFLARPFRRQFWVPTEKKRHPDHYGIVLVSLSHLSILEVQKLKRVLSHYQIVNLLDDSLPLDHTHEHLQVESAFSTALRVTVCTLRIVRDLGKLLRRELSLSHVLRQSDDWARLQIHLMNGVEYLHLNALAKNKVELIRRLHSIINGLEHCRYEIWVIARFQKTAYLPAHYQLPVEPLKVREVSAMASRRLHLGLALKELKRAPREPGVIRVMSYNVHSCIGLDGRHSIRRIVDVLHRYNPDFVAIQELDSGCQRSQGLDQLEELKKAWPSEGQFFPLEQMNGGFYGIGFLTRLPITHVENHVLPTVRQMMPQELRGAQCVTLEWESGVLLKIVNLHLGLTPRERMAQLQPMMIKSPEVTHEILLGDFNCSPKSSEYKLVCRHWNPSQDEPQKTWFGTFPVRHLDYCFWRGAMEVTNSFVPKNSLTRPASDHLPLVTDFRIC